MIIHSLRIHYDRQLASSNSFLLGIYDWRLFFHFFNLLMHILGSNFLFFFSWFFDLRLISGLLFTFFFIQDANSFTILDLTAAGEWCYATRMPFGDVVQFLPHVNA